MESISFPPHFCISQWMLQIPGATSYIGAIGKDKFGEEMKKNSKLAGVNVSFSSSYSSLSQLDFKLLTSFKEID